MISLCRLAFFSLMFVAPLLSAGENPAASNEMKPPPPPKEFLYVLRLIPRLHDDKAWTEADQAAINGHVAHLKAATDRGQLVLAGRTLEPGDRTFGLVVFLAPNEEVARAFMNADPAVAGGIMTAELHPYHVAFRGR